MGKKSVPPPEKSVAAVSAAAVDDAVVYESAHVHAVYDAIASHFAVTRHGAWPKVGAFLRALPGGALVADVGCGNGKNMADEAAAHVHILGTDRCVALAAAAGRHGDALAADVREQPFRGGVFDAALNIAVVHHLCNRERRVQAWAETVRLLRVGGRALCYVWALERPTHMEQPRRAKNMLTRRFHAQDMFVPWHHRVRKEGAVDDRILGGTSAVFMRYYHVYVQGELEAELADVPGAHVVESYYDHQNWCAIVERVDKGTSVDRSHTDEVGDP